MIKSNLGLLELPKPFRSWDMAEIVSIGSKKLNISFVR